MLCDYGFLYCVCDCCICRLFLVYWFVVAFCLLDYVVWLLGLGCVMFCCLVCLRDNSVG